MDLNKLTIHELRERLDKKEISPKDIMGDVISQIDKTEGVFHAYVSVDRDELLRSAETCPEGKPLSGIPIAIKDNICIQGVETTCASKILSGFISTYDATVIKRLKDSGAILIPRANMDEFAMGSSTETSHYGPTRNPHDTSRVSGGSSGGSCVAVAGNEAIAALGSDTGGSIRQPAALCGVVGLKPTYGRVSRYGLMAFASSLDQIGPITKDVTDSALMMNIISGYDALDSTSVEKPVSDYALPFKGKGRKYVIGIPKEYFIEGIDLEIRNAVMDAVKVFQSDGAEVEEISLPHTEYAVSVYYIIATAEASSNLARYDGMHYGYRSAETRNQKPEIRKNKNSTSLMDVYRRTRAEGFGSEVKRRIILGTYVLSSGYYDAYYLKAQKVRTLMIKDFENAFKKVDVIITPTSPTAAFKIGERTEDPLKMYLSDVFTISANLAGLPAISVPCGFTKERLPVGLQLIGKLFDEETLLQAAYFYEQNK